ncbi:MAG: class IIb bacteriocin, lactobin A/cerein 7B family [Spirochaetales bacterium]|nr:class IIb bacteriocin, lactobin A/cerein 7B family [Spirochaetales bacterium]
MAKDSDETKVKELKDQDLEDVSGGAGPSNRHRD